MHPITLECALQTLKQERAPLSVIREDRLEPRIGVDATYPKIMFTGSNRQSNSQSGCIGYDSPLNRRQVQIGGFIDVIGKGTGLVLPKQDYAVDRPGVQGASNQYRR